MSTPQVRLKEHEMADTGSNAQPGERPPKTVQNLAPIRSGRIRADGAELYYEVDGEGEPLLFI